MNNLKSIKIVGILNLSPESFGSESYSDHASMLNRVDQMVFEGADCIDVGAQSTKPTSIQLTVEEELKRLNGVIRSIKTKYPSLIISVDTTRLETAKLAVSEGADMVNDISGGRFNSEIVKLVIGTKNKYILTHSQGSFENIHLKYEYKDLMSEIKEYFIKRIKELEDVGVGRDQIVLDPGIGFSKSGDQNIEIIKRLDELHSLGFPLYVGISRKKFIGTIIGKDNPIDRDNGTTVLHTICMQKGVTYIRTHNVAHAKECVRLLNVLEK